MTLEFSRPGFLLRCGDSKVELAALPAGDLCDIGFSDVPYGLGLDIVGDEDAAKTAEWSVPAMLQRLKPAAPLLCWNCESQVDVWMRIIERNGGMVHSLIYWDKDNPYFDRRSKELLIVATNGPVLTVYNDDAETAWLHRTVRDEALRETHKTPKPLTLQKRALRRFAPPGARVLDAFAGGGDIAVAALQMGLGYTGFEIVPRHVVGAVERLAQVARAQESNVRLHKMLTSK